MNPSGSPKPLRSIVWPPRDSYTALKLLLPNASVKREIPVATQMRITSAINVGRPADPAERGESHGCVFDGKWLNRVVNLFR
jgi:hypothetical protein